MIDICEFANCTGCSACLNICPSNAISMKEDQFGFLKYSINQTICIDCNLCKKICPNIDDNYSRLKHIPRKVLASYVQSKELLSTCTSGGLATCISEYFLNEFDNSIVYGCQSTSFKAIHQGVTDISELYKFKGSKYIQSDLSISFKEIKANLLNNKKILFIGTPCQVSGLLSFLKKKYDNLYTIDLLCHGVSSSKYLASYLKSENLNVDIISNISFRKKGKKETDIRYGTYVYNSSKCIYSKSAPYNKFILGFFRGLTINDSCFHCKYNSIERVGDISLGDFWGVKLSNKSLSKNKGISLVLVNSENGEHIISKIKNRIHAEEKDINDALNSNRCLKYNASKPIDYEKFRELYTLKQNNVFNDKIWYKISINSKLHFYKSYFIIQIKNIIKSLVDL